MRTIKWLIVDLILIFVLMVALLGVQAISFRRAIKAALKSGKMIIVSPIHPLNPFIQK
jgi:hypothetical protein